MSSRGPSTALPENSYLSKFFPWLRKIDPLEWEAVDAKWKDFEYTFTRDTGFFVEGMGMLRPLDAERLTYTTISGVVIPLPAKQPKRDILPLLQSLESQHPDYFAMKDS